MFMRNALDKLTLGRRRGRSQGSAKPAGDLTTRLGSPEESALPAHHSGPSTPRGDRVRLDPPLSTTANSAVPPFRPVACTFSRDELSTLSKFPSPRLPTDPPALPVTPAHMSSRRFQELQRTQPPTFTLGRESTDGAIRHVSEESPALNRFGVLGSEEGIGLGISIATPSGSARTALSEGREALNTLGSSSLNFTNTNNAHPLMVGDPSGHQQGEASGSVGVLNMSSQHQARTYTAPILPSRFVSSSNFVEGHPGFRQTGFDSQQTGFRQNSFQQDSFQRSNAQQSNFQQNSSQQSSFQQSRTRNMFDDHRSAETDDTLRRESPRRQQNRQSRSRNAFDGSSSAETPSSQRRDVHNMSYRDFLSPLQSTGRRIDEEAGSSLADNSDNGSVSNFHGDATLSIPLPQRAIPATLVSRIPSPMRLPPPPSAEAQTSSETMMYPPHPRYQYSSSIAEDQNDRRMIAPDYRYVTGGTVTRRDAHDGPVEGTMASYTHPLPLRRPTPNPFVTPPPLLVLGGRRVFQDDDMMGRNEVGQMQYAEVGSAPAQTAARNAASNKILRAADEAANEAPDAATASRHRYHRSDKSATSTEAEPPTTAPTRDRNGGVRRPAIRESILERHRQDLTTMGLLNPTSPPPAHVRPTHTFEIEEPAHWAARGATRSSAAFTAALGLMQGLRRMPDEEEMVSVPMGHHLPVEGPPRLLQTARAYRACLAEKQEMTSKAIFVLCGVFPPAWLLYTCGGFDWYMRHVTRGAVEEMSAVWKKRAWFLGVVWGLVTVVVFADILLLSR